MPQEVEVCDAPDAGVPHGTALIPLLRAILCELKIISANFREMNQGAGWDPDQLREDPDFLEHRVIVK